MALFCWNNEDALFVPAIDSEHRMLFGMAKKLHRAVQKRAGKQDLQHLSRQLVLHAVSHFSHEEDLMRSTRCPSYAWHKGQHDTAHAGLLGMERQVRRGNREKALLLLESFAGWLTHHSRLSDRMMAAHVRNHDRAVAAGR